MTQATEKWVKLDRNGKNENKAGHPSVQRQPTSEPCFG